MHKHFEHIFDLAGEEVIFKGVNWRVATIPIFILCKMSAYEDRKFGRDLSDIAFCLRHYEEDVNSETRFGAMGVADGLEWEFAGAFALGREGREHLNKNISGIIERFLKRFSSFEMPAVDRVLREDGRVEITDDMRKKVFDLFDWYKKGLEVKL